MFWLGFIIGLFVGANIGIVVAGMLLSAKAGDTSAHPNEHKVLASFASEMNSATDQESSQPVHESAQNKKEYTDDTLS